ncbi:peptidoglycan DD-metalloendopeptidase family protein [Algoriphagus namhaensis]|uniref:Peptidoglycan DD-metalloendopeptidase family protein n=1 Tax=Algoriphagus namhaensis TaxID=915353 RepID=A0ABV8ARV7_9BACT
MNWKDMDFFPIMGIELTTKNTTKLDFSPSNEGLKSVDLSNTESFDSYVFGQLESQGKAFGIGGYLEHRAIYQRAEMFATAAEDFRNIHLGVDIWTKAGAEVFVPLDGKVHSIRDNEGFANYGPTIILEHELDGEKLYSLYGHLSREDLKFLRKGQHVISGELLCHVGPFPENGDWPPHLHFQLMWDMQGLEGDYPGVCSSRERKAYALNCPNPNLIIRSEVLD